MPCNCSGVRMKRCSCKVFGYPLAKSRTQNVVLVEEEPESGAADDNHEKLNMFLRLFEHLYDKCAEYNLRTHNVVLVEEEPESGAADDNHEILNLFLSAFEHLYVKCAEYNLRYCPLRGKHKRGKPLANAAKDMVILIWFLVANFIVFLNISTRITIHIFFVLLEIVKWIERRAQDVVKRRSLKSECDQTIVLNSRLHKDC